MKKHDSLPRYIAYPAGLQSIRIYLETDAAPKDTGSTILFKTLTERDQFLMSLKRKKVLVG